MEREKRQARWLGFAALALVAWFPAVAAAQPSDPEAEGKRLAGEALEAYQATEFDKALGLFEKASEYYPVAQVLRMTGYTLQALDRWEEAADKIEAAIESTNKPLSDEHRQDAQTQLEKVLKHLSKLTVKSTVPGAMVRIDGGEPKVLPYSKRLLEGSHSIKVSAPDRDDATQSLELKGGEPKDVSLDPKKHEEAPPPPPPPEPEPETKGAGWFPYQGPIGLAVAGAGAALAGVGIGTLVYGVTLRGAASDNLDTHLATYGAACEQGDLTLCYYDTQLINIDGDRAQRSLSAGIGLTVAGGVLLATGITFVAAAPSILGSGETEGDGDSKSKPAIEALACMPSFGTTGASLGCVGAF